MPSRCSSIGPAPCAPDFGLPEPETAAAVTEICETLDGLPLGHRAGGRAHGCDERGRGQGPTRRPVPSVARVATGPGATAHAAPCRRVVLRPADRRRAGAAPPDVGVRRRLRPVEHLRGGRRGRRDRRAPAPRLAGPQVARRRRPLRRPHALQPVRDHPPVRRGPVGGGGRARADARPARRVLRAASPPPDGSAGTGPGGATRSTGWSSSSATSVPDISGARDEASWRWRPTSPRTPRSWASRCSCSRRSPGPRSCSSRQPRPTSAGFPACTRRPAMRASPGGRRRPARTRTGRPSWRSTTATTRASRGTPSFVEALGQVYCGDLDRYVELTGDGGASATEAIGATAWPSYVDGLQSCGRIEEALALTEESVAAARSLGNPYWISYALWIAGHGVLEGGRASRVRRLGRGRRLRARAPASTSSRASSPATRHACTPPTASPRRRWCCSPRPSPRSSGPATCRS